MRIAVVGCGYVSDFYASTLGRYGELSLAGVFDKNPANLESFCRRWSANSYATLEDVAGDPNIELVLNLTNPRSHYEVTKCLLSAGKHVYSEKPLAMTSEKAQDLVAIATQNQLHLGVAPCSVLGETAQTMWKALKDGVVGRPRLVYADFDDGMIAPNMSPWRWSNDRSVPWPAKDEFEVGCTYEHAGYFLTWLAAFFGPARKVTSFASCQIPDKGISVDGMAPDFTVGCIEYANGVVARVTCGLVAPHSKSLSIIGDHGVLSTPNLRNDTAPVYVRRIPQSRMLATMERCFNALRRGLEWLMPSVPWSGNDCHFHQRLPLARKPTGRLVSRGKPVDFCRGPAEMAEAILQRRPCRLSGALGVHITELVEALQYPERFGGTRNIESEFDPIEPLPWR